MTPLYKICITTVISNKCLFVKSHDKDSHIPKPSHTIRIANQLTGFYMMQTLTERFSQTDFNND